MTTQDLNDLYRRVINSNHRFRKLKELHAPDIIVNNEHRVFDDAVSALLSEGEIAHMVNGVGADAFINYFNYIAGTEIGFPIAAAGAA